MENWVFLPGKFWITQRLNVLAYWRSGKQQRQAMLLECWARIILPVISPLATSCTAGEKLLGQWIYFCVLSLGFVPFEQMGFVPFESEVPACKLLVCFGVPCLGSQMCHPFSLIFHRDVWPLAGNASRRARAPWKRREPAQKCCMLARAKRKN